MWEAGRWVEGGAVERGEERGVRGGRRGEERGRGEGRRGEGVGSGQGEGSSEERDRREIVEVQVE